MGQVEMICAVSADSSVRVHEARGNPKELPVFLKAADEVPVPAGKKPRYVVIAHDHVRILRRPQTFVAVLGRALVSADDNEVIWRDRFLGYFAE